jgi:squalene-hopene/tetraprenyl-beta-curcumene cyclase
MQCTHQFRRIPRAIWLSAMGVAALVGMGGTPAFAADKKAPAAPGWDRQAAARYLDSREDWWQTWDHAKRDHGTMCISCHTQAPFAMARPVLRGEMGEPAPDTQENAMLADVEKRVHEWKDMLPFYSDAIYGAGKEVESRNAESVLNAVILSSYDLRVGHMSEVTHMAFEHAWELQSKTGPDAGSWVWQNFAYTPWESTESQYYWAAQLAQTVAVAPDNYRRDPTIAVNLTWLKGYLRGHYEAQPLLNKIVALRAAANFSDLLTKTQRRTLIRQLASLQRPDGGWSLSDLGTWQRRDKTPLETRPDGFATAITTLALEENGIKSDQVKHGIAWLEVNQDKTTGAWPAWSLNKNRDPQSNVGLFMSDAATGYAVLALDARR